MKTFTYMCFIIFNLLFCNGYAQIGSDNMLIKSQYTDTIKVDSGFISYLLSIRNHKNITKKELDSIRMVYETKIKNKPKSKVNTEFTSISHTSTLDDKELFIILLEEILQEKINAENPIVIFYHQGRKSCGRFSLKSPITNQEWRKTIENKMSEITNVNSLYMYRSKEGLGVYEIENWHNDYKGIIENIFFKNRKPCGSLVIVGKTNTYIAQFGEYDQATVLKLLEEISLEKY